MNETAKQPALTTLQAKKLTPEALAKFFEKLTGRAPTAQEMERIRQRQAAKG